METGPTVRVRRRRRGRSTRSCTRPAAATGGSGHRRRMQYAGDGHDHWHVARMLTYHLWGSDRHAQVVEGGVLLLRHEPHESEPAGFAERRVLQGIDVRATRFDEHAQRDLGRLGRQVPRELRVPVGRRDRTAGGDVHASERRGPVQGLPREVRHEQLRVGPDQDPGQWQHRDGARPGSDLRQRLVDLRRSRPTSHGPGRPR